LDEVRFLVEDEVRFPVEVFLAGAFGVALDLLDAEPLDLDAALLDLAEEDARPLLDAARRDEARRLVVGGRLTNATASLWSSSHSPRIRSRCSSERISLWRSTGSVTTPVLRTS
jgi:hypothetical protein